MNKTYEKIKKLRAKNIEELLNNPGLILAHLEELEEMGQYSQVSLNFITKKKSRQDSSQLS